MSKATEQIDRIVKGMPKSGCKKACGEPGCAYNRGGKCPVGIPCIVGRQSGRAGMLKQNKWARIAYNALQDIPETKEVTDGDI